MWTSCNSGGFLSNWWPNLGESRAPGLCFHSPLAQSTHEKDASAHGMVETSECRCAAGVVHETKEPLCSTWPGKRAGRPFGGGVPVSHFRPGAQNSRALATLFSEFETYWRVRGKKPDYISNAWAATIRDPAQGAHKTRGQ